MGNLRPINRIEFLLGVIPKWVGPQPGRWLDACTPFLPSILVDLAKERRWLLTVVDLNPREPGIPIVDLTVFDESLGTFDLITCMDTLEHINAYPAALENLRRYCNPEAALIISVPSMGLNPFSGVHAKEVPTDQNHHHEWLFHTGLLRAEIKAAGFDVLAEHKTHELGWLEFGHFFFCRARGTEP